MAEKRPLSLSAHTATVYSESPNVTTSYVFAHTHNSICFQSPGSVQKTLGEYLRMRPDNEGKDPAHDDDARVGTTGKRHVVVISYDDLAVSWPKPDATALV